MGSPKHLWSGDWEEESARVGARRPAQPPTTAQPAPEAKPTPRPTTPPPAPRQPTPPPQQVKQAPRRRRIQLPPKEELRRWAVAATVAAIAAFLSGAVVTLIARGDTGHPAASSSTQTQSTNRSQAAPKSRRAWLGVEMESWPMGGAVVNRVAPSGPAASAGLMPGDLIVSFNGSPVGEASDVTGALARLHPGQVVSVQIRRGSAPMTVQVTLAARPGGSRAP